MAESMRERANERQGQGATSNDGGELELAAGSPEQAVSGAEPHGKAAGQKVGSAASQLREKARGLGDRVKGRASDVAESGKSGVVGRIDQVSDRIEGRAQSMEAEGGLKGKAGHAVHRASDALEDSADYLRTHEIGSIRDDVQVQIQGHPFLSVGLALGTGFMLGRVLGGGDQEERCEPLEQETRSGNEPGRMDRWKARARSPVGRAAMSGLSAVVANQVRKRVAGRRT